MSAARSLLKALLRPAGPAPVKWPEGKRFAFTIVDDTDVSTLESIRPMYALLQELGLRTTKTVWMLPTNDPSQEYNHGDTVSDPAYRAFVLELQARGIEIGSHGARGGSSTRDETERALQEFREVFGHDPKVHVNHAFNRENLYSGPEKLGFQPLRLIYRLVYGDHFEGHRPESPYFWGDIARDTVTYIRDFHFDAVDVMSVYPRVPFRDRRRPYAPFWFHASDGSALDSFCRLLRPDNLDRLEERGGLCIVYTHFGKDFCVNGRVNERAEERLRDVASRPGWFAPVGEVLDHLRAVQGDWVMPAKDRVYMELAWALEKLTRGRT